MVSAVPWELPYLMVATAAEDKLQQFHAILPKTPSEVVPVSRQMDLATSAGRANAMIAAINLHRLHGVKACLPNHVLPLVCGCAALLTPAAIKSSCQSVVREANTIAAPLIEEINSVDWIEAHLLHTVDLFHEQLLKPAAAGLRPETMADHECAPSDPPLACIFSVAHPVCSSCTPLPLTSLTSHAQSCIAPL